MQAAAVGTQFHQEATSFRVHMMVQRGGCTLCRLCETHCWMQPCRNIILALSKKLWVPGRKEHEEDIP